MIWYRLVRVNDEWQLLCGFCFRERRDSLLGGQFTTDRDLMSQPVKTSAVRTWGASCERCGAQPDEPDPAA